MASDLHRRLFKHEQGQESVPDEDAEGVETLGDLGGHVSSSRSPGRQPAHYEPLTGRDFFDEALSIESEGDAFRVYLSPPRPERARDPGATKNGTLVVCHHGANSTGLSYACFAADLRRATDGEIGCLAFDARGHGKTDVRGTEPPVLSLERLSSDLVRLLRVMFPDRTTAPAMVLVGHSMGGPVVVDACSDIQRSVAPVVGCAVLDAVEGTALDAIPAVHSMIQNLPRGFDSVSDAIAWHLTSGTIHNATSARVSVPPLLKSSHHGVHAIEWRLNLAATEPYWTGWFTGLSDKFLAIKTAKLLVLAGTDRLDKPLMVGQMQGKFQLTVWPDVGHSLHEDAPERLAQLIVEFWRRNDTTDILKNVKKVGQT